MGHKQEFIDKSFKNENGEVALAAEPNLLIIIWAVAALISHLIKHSLVHTLLIVIAFAAIAIWALLEIFQGVNYFRRLLGLVILVLIIHNLLH
jgi:hypothetical protein